MGASNSGYYYVIYDDISAIFSASLPCGEVLFFVYKSFQKRVSCENALFSLMKIVSKIINIGALNSGYNYVI